MRYILISVIPVIMSNSLTFKFKSIRVGLIVNGSLFQNTDFVAKDLRKFDDTKNTCLISQNIIFYYS